MHRERSESRSRAPRSPQQGLEASSSSEDALTGQYEVLRSIGKGSFGTVRLARHILTGAEVAVKTVSKGELDPALLQAEVAIMKAVEHPSVVQLFQVMETADRVYLVMEYAGWGQLLQYIPEGVGLPEWEAQGLFEQVVSALCTCHAQGIAHRDVKAQNILLDSRGRIKLCDFGLGCQFRQGELLDTLCGTITYWAPEMFLQQAYIGPAVDVWSLGVVLYLMLTGHLPFDGDTFEELMDQVLHRSWVLPAHVSIHAQDLVAKMLTVDTTERPSMAEVARHPWLKCGQCPFVIATRKSRRRFCPDPSTVKVMLDLGFNLTDTWTSLKGRKFDEAMATYLLLRHQHTQGVGFTVQRRSVHSGLQPRSSAGSLPATLPRQRSASKPTSHSRRVMPAVQQPRGEHLRPGQRGNKGGSLPALALPSLQAQSPAAPSMAPQQDLAALPPGPGSGGHRSQVEGSISPQGVSGGEQALPRQQAQGGTAGSSQEGTKAWRRVARRILTCLTRMCCCCVAAPRTGPRQENGVARTPEMQARRLRNKVLPEMVAS
ncbi:putative sperm motility kinase W [Marmota flaviventris]|uniref:putative sperm motility kinase W n=1 Tax=Marmota flaviventris TaxID=93162 RepID=UPI000FFFBB64|nr:putative sperm motility kinase W [Marmota flaviventris]